MRQALPSLLLVLATAACATPGPPPVANVRGELVWRYPGRMELWSGSERIANAPTWRGLEAYVGCVPDAARHAQRAERSGAGAATASAIAILSSLGGLGGLYGLSYSDTNRGAMWAFLGTGLVLELVAVTAGGVSLAERTKATGNAVDAANFYNDALFEGASPCR